MASALVDAVVEKLVGKLIEEINKEVSLFCNFRNDFQWLRKKLANVRGYLTDAEAQSARNASVKSWLLDVADIAWDAEDILQECALQYQGTNNEIPQSSCVCAAFSYSQLLFRYKMARRIKEVRDRMKSVMEGAAELKLVADLTHPEQPASTSTSGNVMWRGSPSDSRPVAIQPKVDEVLRLILDDPSAAPVIAVVGMGGVGKTFLMQNVFDRAKGRFEMSIWLSISQTYSVRKLQADMAAQIKLQGEQDAEIKSKADMVIYGQITELHARQLIHECLTSRRSLIVLDDVWRAAGEDDLISALGIPRGNNSHCKIVVTTRSRNVSRSMHARLYEVHPLSEEESWKLFCAFAFPDCPQNQPPRLFEGIARQVERECARLPLAVRTVAASLANERSSIEWESKLSELRAVISYGEDPIMQILKLSYDSLPAHLKPCFAYLSFFPKDEIIEYQYLIDLWVAEGFVPQGEDQLDVGWRYICHLQSLCLLERVDDIYDQRYRRFKVHDLLLDLAISISKESQCVFRAEEALKKDPTVQGSSRYRRILMAKKSIGDGDVNVLASNRAYSASRLRTLSFSKNEGIENIPAMLLSSARVLRVLDLSGTHISSLPDSVGNLKLLRFFNLRDTKISEVPECVRNNKSLLFLDISTCENLERLPEWIGELSCLQHLDIRLASRESKFNGLMPKGISKLVSLQGLNINKLSVEENGRFLRLEHFVNLVNLREVRIAIRHVAELKSIEDGILATLVKMRTLSIANSVKRYDDEQANLPPLSENMLAMNDLEYLYLSKFAVPNWILGFSNLLQLSLWRCHCIEYPAPNLIKLELRHNNICKALPKGFGKPGGFPQLRYFEIYSFRVLEELPELEDGAMPHLEMLGVSRCNDLKKVPAGLELLKSLKECDFRMSGVRDVFKEGSELWNKMKAKNSNVRIRE